MTSSIASFKPWMAQQAVQDANSLSTQLLDGFAMYGMPRQTGGGDCARMHGDEW
ncbi:MAG: hypothetical protein U0905_12560 [Pirellulales bacterium]